MSPLQPAHADTTSAPYIPPSPWMTLKDVASYAICHYQTVYEACANYTAGDRSPKALKNFQRAAGCARRVYRTDVDRWIAGQPPLRVSRIA